MPKKFLSFLIILTLATMTQAGFDRLLLSTDDTTTNSECQNLNQEQQQQLIQAYQKTYTKQQKLDLKKRMEWFCHLPIQEQQQIRTAWQNLSSQERKELKTRLAKATTPAEREQIRQEMIKKFSSPF